MSVYNIGAISRQDLGCALQQYTHSIPPTSPLSRAVYRRCSRYHERRLRCYIFKHYVNSLLTEFTISSSPVCACRRAEAKLLPSFIGSTLLFLRLVSGSIRALAHELVPIPRRSHALHIAKVSSSTARAFPRPPRRAVVTRR
jgi:hypothetical protein